VPPHKAEWMVLNGIAMRKGGVLVAKEMPRALKEAEQPPDATTVVGKYFRGRKSKKSEDE